MVSVITWQAERPPYDGDDNTVTRIGTAANDFTLVMPANSPAAKFIEESVNHPEWLKTIEAGQPDAVVALAKEHGFECTLDDLKQAARELLPVGGEGSPDKTEIDEAASGMSELETDTGYGNDTGYAALYGVAGIILKI